MWYVLGSAFVPALACVVATALGFDDMIDAEPSRRGARLGPSTDRSGSWPPSAHEFCGRHLVASYIDCNPHALRDLEALRAAFHSAVLASGATPLRVVEQVFPPDGLTLLVLVAESHASIHTYPEYDACFVDLFTCGRACRVECFDQVLRGYLHPAAFERRIINRDRTIRIDPLEESLQLESRAG